jgi:hypothetical protein
MPRGRVWDVAAAAAAVASDLGIDAVEVPAPLPAATA